MKHVALAQNARHDRVYLRKRVSTGHSGWVFIRGAPAPSGYEYVRACTYVWRMHAACRRTPLNVLLVHFCLPGHLRVYICGVPLYAPNDDPSLFVSAIIRSGRVAIACTRMHAARYVSSRDALSHTYRLPRVLSPASAFKHVFSARAFATGVVALGRGGCSAADVSLRSWQKLIARSYIRGLSHRRWKMLFQ